MKRLISIFLGGVLIMSNMSFVSATPTEDEIEKRITEVGEEYIKFYKDGRTSEEDYDMMAPTSVNVSAEKAASTGGADTGAVLESVEDGYVEEEYFEDEEVTYLSGDASFDLDEEELDIGTVNLVDSYDFPEDYNTEEYSSIKENGFVSVKTQPFSTFGADIDTASYSSLRRKLLEPYSMIYDQSEPYFYGIEDSAIRVEELMNYFNYGYSEPEDGEKFGVSTYLTKCPWNEDTLLLKVGIKAEDIKEESKGSNIVLLIDTSGSMFSFDCLDLVKTSMEFLIKNLDKSDTVSIVTYAGGDEVILEGEPGDHYDEIMKAIKGLEAWGSTYGEGGINKAYEIAEKYFIEGGNNRVVLCTDGDFNVGVSSEAGLKDLISKKKETGVFFSCLGFGSGNYSDTTMKTLASNGNGNYSYIDCPREANKALDEEFFSTIYTVAKDTKFQVEFNPKAVKGYRLIGYETRKMAAEDFANDKKDGGEVGANQTVTVLYEVVPIDSNFEIPEVVSKYGTETEVENPDKELLTVNIRYKEPNADKSVLKEYPVTMDDFKEEMDEDTSWAAGVAQAGMLMRDSEYSGTSTFNDIYDRLKFDPEIMENDYKAEFLYLLRTMKKYKEQEEKEN